MVVRGSLIYELSIINIYVLYVYRVFEFNTIIIINNYCRMGGTIIKNSQ